MNRRIVLLPVALVSLLVIAVTFWVDDRGSETAGGIAATSTTGAASMTVTTEAPYDGWSDPAKAGRPYPGAKVNGLLTFRGSPTRSYHGKGPVPTNPEVEYRFPESGMCRESSAGGVTKVWCGMGWTGQPAVVEWGGTTWAVFGGYDGEVHFIDADTGERLLPNFPTGDIIKGSVTIDPDGYELVYTGSRDNKFRILRVDGTEAEQVWSLDAKAFGPTKWNDDWDSSPLIIDDYLFEGGENSRWYVVKLNRGRDAAGRPTVDPEVVFHGAGWDQELLSAIGDDAVSVEASLTVVGNTVYFPNSGGLVQGWDISSLAEGEAPERVFRYWVGDDTDASIVADAEGMLYVASEYERAGTASRSGAVGQLIKLDPTVDVAAGEDPLVWSVFDDDVRPGGLWGTPAVVDGVVYAGTDGGRFFAVDAATGTELWSMRLPGPVWGSPSVVDDVLLIGDCDGFFHAFDVSDRRTVPPELWSIELGGCIEATPAVWKGRILIGTRAGFLYSLVDAGD